MNLPGLIENLLRLGLLLAGLLLPGSMVIRALRLPWSLAAAFVTSSAVLYTVVLLFSCTGCPITLLTLGGALGLVALIGRLVPVRRISSELTSSFSCFTKMGAWLPLYLAFWAIVGYRLVAQPLSGPDVFFRWSWLGEQMLQAGSLNFYPARTGPDFVHYFWAESIPPGIASLYAWAYGCGGNTNALWTSPVVALQLLSLHEVVWRLASRWGGEIVARRAVLLAAACPLLTWSCLIGQETGLTALSVCGLVWCLHHSHEEDGLRWVALAGVFAIAGSSTRKYGPIFAVAAIVAMLLLAAPRRQTLLLALVSLPIALAWPLRVWLLTGNPFYSLTLGGFFPDNALFKEWNNAFRGPHAFTLTARENWLAISRYLLIWALPAVGGLVALLALLVQRLRDAQMVAIFVLLLAGLWFSSVAYTAGGLFYSLRLLSPALALLAVVASYALVFFFHSKLSGRLIALGVILVSLEALPKTLALPENPYRVAPRAWLQAGSTFIDSVRASDAELAVRIKALPGRYRIISDQAGLPRALAPVGSEVIPLWSPEVAWLFDRNLKSEEIARRWKKSGLHYFILGKAGPASDFVGTRAQWRAPYFTVKTILTTETSVVLEVTVGALP